MQQLIRTPEQIFREEGKDIYFIRFQYENAEGYFASPDQVELPVRKAMLAWLREHVPNSRVEYLAPSEYSGWLVGYFGDVRVDFSETDLAAYCARWENMDGTSIDPRFQCSRLPYDCWVEKITKFPPANKRPEEPGVSIWWDTAIGIIYHQISVDEENRQTLRRNPGNERDIWYSATRLWPELEAADFDQLVCGHVTKEADSTFTMYYMPAWTGCQRVDFSIKRQQEILSWLRLPPETEVLEAGF